MSTDRFDALRLHRLGLGPLWLCSLPPPGGSGWLLLPGRSAASSAPGFLATQTSRSQKTGSKVGAACKAAAEFSQECSLLFKEPPCCFPADCQPGWRARRWFKPALGLLGTLLLLRRGGALRRSVLVGASPARLGSAESQGSLTAQTVWQQALLVQVDL